MPDDFQWAISAGVTALVLTLVAEVVHQRRIRRVAALAFGPASGPAPWTHAVLVLRPLAAGLLAWGLVTLLVDVAPKVHKSGIADEDKRHLVLVLDVSPSMRLEDAGPDASQSRLHRARDVLDSMFARISIAQYRTSVIATYSGAFPVVVDTEDIDVVRNVLGDLPMHFAFNKGETRLFDGLDEAARIAEPWEPRTATLVVVSDGDTLPPTGMPVMPPSISGSVVIGVGDPTAGSFVDGRNSRQDVAMLRQMAVRLGGTYHNGNVRHVASEVLASVTEGVPSSPLDKLGLREYALLAILVGAALLALLPWLLHLGGTTFQPGVAGVAMRARGVAGARTKAGGRGRLAARA